MYGVFYGVVGLHLSGGHAGYRSEFSGESLKSYLISAAVRRRGPARSQILALKPCEAVDPLP